MMAEFPHPTQMNTYDLQIGGVEVKTRVVHDAMLVEAALAELEVGGNGIPVHPIVGVDVKVSSNLFGRRRRCDLLILCTRSNCVILQLDLMRRRNSAFRAVTDFLSFKEVFFVCPDGFGKRTRGLPLCEYAKHTITTYGRFGKKIRTPACFVCSQIRVTEISRYAAIFLQNGKPKCESWEKLVEEVGVDLTTASSAKRRPKWDSKLFSEEEILSVIYDVVGSYRIAHKIRHGY